MSTFQTALSGLQAASTDLQVMGNNIANANTVGFKSSNAQFADSYAA
ncbi:flagellar basal body protein, partial [Thiomonas arsenitoxydans]